MLKMRPGCECCNEDLPAQSPDAFICSFECTFCGVCARKMKLTCPNCRGELVLRPRRRLEALAKNPASTERVYKPEGCGK